MNQVSDYGEEEETSRWLSDLEKMAEQIRNHFVRREGFQRAVKYLKGLLSEVERKNGWQMAEVAGDNGPDGIQYLLSRAEWDSDGVRDDLQNYVIEHLGEEEGIAVLDETGFLKKGEKSVGVQRQYSGTAGRVENCQVGVFLGYTSSKGHVLIDRELYLPESWVKDRARRKEAHVPKDTRFHTKPELGRRMLKHAFAQGVPIQWVTGDAVYGDNGKLRQWLEENEHPYVLAVSSNMHVFVDWREATVAEFQRELTEQDWHRLSAGDGSKGPRIYDWAEVSLNSPDDFERTLLIRRSIAKPEEVAYYRVFATKSTSLEEMVRVAGSRWSIEECFEVAKGEVGLDQYEVRSWQGWYRHITLALLAFAFLTVVQSQQTGLAEKKGILFHPKLTQMRPWKTRRKISSR